MKEAEIHHLCPVNDEKDHNTEVPKTICQCGPRLHVEYDTILIVHKSYDKKKINEIAQKIFKDNL